MNKTFRVLGINPKKDQTKIGLYENERCLLERSLFHKELIESDFTNGLDEQVFLRTEEIQARLFLEGINLSKIDAVVARGGLIRPIKGGTYEINQAMLDDLAIGFNGKHPSNLGGLIAKRIADSLDLPAFIVDPVVVDELDHIAKMTGLPEIERRSIFHALNQKSAARKAARDLQVDYHESNFIVAHLGTGITIGAHQNGKVIDVNNGLNGEGPFSPERAGSLPTGDLISLCFQEGSSEKMLQEKVSTQGGLLAHLKTTKLTEVIESIKQNDPELHDYLEVMAYQIAKEIGSLSAVLYGQVQAIVLTGELAYNSFFIKQIMRRTKWIADILTYPGENDLESLVDGALRVLNESENAKQYVVKEGE